MKNKGFTMIELLAAVVILGVLSIIAIASVTNLKDKAKKEDDEVYKKSLKMAAETYLQSNKSQYPRTIGQYTYLTSEFLTEKKYLKEDKGGYVIIRKTSNSDYEYEVVPNKKAPDSNVCTPKPPVPTVEFTDAQLNPIGENISNNFEDATLHIEMDGGKYPDNHPVHPGEDVEIAGYSYKLYAKTEDDPNLHEVFNSGSLPANGNIHLSVIKPVREHIEITGLTYLTAKVEVVNALGCSYPVALNDDGDEGEDTYDAQGSYKDTIPPTCIKIDGESNTWISKTDGNDSRVITATCEDGKGSGCIRPQFKRSWPNDHQPDAEWSYIQVQDNAGNFNLPNSLIENNSLCNSEVVQSACRVKVNVDKTTPTIKVIGAYKANSNGTPADGTNVFKRANYTINDANANANNSTTFTGNIASNEYDNLFGGWMNLTNYPNGVIFKIEISDNIHLDHWTWQVNDDLLTTKTNDNVLNTLGDQYKNTGYSSTIQGTTTNWTGNCGMKSQQILVGFKNEGLRRGKLVVYDKAGNYISLKIAANLDRTAPPIPHITYSDNYRPGKWTNQKVVARGLEEDKVDNLSGPKNNQPITLSGWKEFRYMVTKDYDTSFRDTGTDDTYNFDEPYQGKNQIKLDSCDAANNCSGYCSPEGVWVDFIYPKCTVTTTNHGSLSATNWLGIGESATVTATCTDTETYGSDRQSDCYNGTGVNDIKKVYSTLYDYDINTSKAGGKGVGIIANIRDVAGNKTTCPADQTVKIDHQAPECRVTGESTTWALSRTIKRTCSDPTKNNVSSGCTPGSTFSDTYNEDNKTVKTVKFVNYDIYDKADNHILCTKSSYETDKTNLNVYVDRQAPSCTWTKGHTTHTDGTHSGAQGNPDGITIDYTCSDAGVGGYVCPKDIKAPNYATTNQSTIVKDALKNSRTCSVTVHKKTEYRYRKKDAPATCSKSCCGYKTCRTAACGCKTYKKTCDSTHCGTNTHYDYKWGSWTTGSPGCGGNWDCISISYRTVSTGGGNYQYQIQKRCRCARVRYTCKSCRHSTHGCETYYSCAAAACGNKTCTNAQCCGYKCGTNHWNAWGGSNNGCHRDSRPLYY